MPTASTNAVAPPATSGTEAPLLSVVEATGLPGSAACASVSASAPVVGACVDCVGAVVAGSDFRRPAFRPLPPRAPRSRRASPANSRPSHRSRPACLREHHVRARVVGVDRARVLPDRVQHMVPGPVRGQLRRELVRAVPQRRVRDRRERLPWQIGPRQRLCGVVPRFRQEQLEGPGVRDGRPVGQVQCGAGGEAGGGPVGAGQVEPLVGGEPSAAQLPVRDDLPVPSVHPGDAHVVPRGERSAVRGDRRPARRRPLTAALGRTRRDPAHRIRRRAVRPGRGDGARGEEQRGREGDGGGRDRAATGAAAAAGAAGGQAVHPVRPIHGGSRAGGPPCRTGPGGAAFNTATLFDRSDPAMCRAAAEPRKPGEAAHQGPTAGWHRGVPRGSRVFPVSP